MTWFREAADAGDVGALYNVGVLYEHGYGVPQDSTQAAIWYRKAADSGHEPSKKWLAEHSK